MFRLYASKKKFIAGTDLCIYNHFVGDFYDTAITFVRFDFNSMEDVSLK